MLHNRKFRMFTWYTSVGLLVFLAVTMSLLRIIFSSVEGYRGQLEELAGKYLGQPVTISNMDARVVGISPSVIFSDVALLEKRGEIPLTRFDAVSIALDPIASLRTGSVIIELTVSGAKLEVTRKLDGSFSVQGLEFTSGEEGDVSSVVDQEDAGQVLGEWFLSQSHLALRDSHITLHDEKRDERFSFNNVDLELSNEDTQHNLNGTVHLPKNIGRELRVAAEIEGNPFQGNDWRGAFYVKAVQLQPHQLLPHVSEHISRQISEEGRLLRSGLFDAEVWSHWGRGMMTSLRTIVSASAVKLARNSQATTIRRIYADGRMKLDEDGWRIDVGGLQIQHTDSAPITTQLEVIKKGEAISLQADQLQLDVIAALLPYVPWLDQRKQSMIVEMAPAGQVRNLHMHLTAERQFALQGELSGLVVKPWEKLPGINGLDAQFRFDGERGQIQLSSAGTQLTMPHLFRDSLSLEKLDGKVEVQRDEQDWYLSSSTLSVSNQDADIQMDLEMRLAEGRAPWLSVQGVFSDIDARVVPRYLPVGVIKKETLRWLDNAFKKGRVPHGSFQYHGYTNHFPFRQKQGRFEVLFEAEAVQLHYQDDWPDLQRLNGKVHFDGPGMRIDASSARIFDARIGRTSVSIANFRMPRLLVDGNVRLPLRDGLRFLRQSPLSRHTGTALDAMQARGKGKLGLKLEIPLSTKARKVKPLSVNGNLNFSGGQLEVATGVQLQELEGRLHFTEKSFIGDQLKALLFDKPLAIDVATEEGDISRVVVAGRGQGALPVMRDALQLPLLDHLDGTADWQVKLTLPRGAPEEGVVLRIGSTLEGVASALPQPLVKAASEQRDLQMTLHLTGARSGETRLTVGEEFGLAWQQQGKGDERVLRRVKLQLGQSSSPLVLPERDVIEVVGNGARVALGPWLEVLRNELGSGEGSRNPLPVVVALKRLHLLSDGTTGEAEQEDLRLSRMPAMSVEVEQFSYDDWQLGTLEFEVVPQQQQALIRDIRVESDSFKLSGEGTWADQGNTFFNFKLGAPELGKMMSDLGFASVIRGGKLDASGKLWWAGSPAAVSLSRLNAALDIKIDEGTIVDVDPGAGRLLGILSIPALPRRLFLDFRDVFREGLDFKSIKGNITIEKGQAYTSNLRLESVPASILISGRSGLVTQDFDQEMFVVPNVSDTATVVSALAWGPQVAAVVVLLQELFKSDIGAATMTSYRITGSWEKPVIKRIEMPQLEEEDTFPFPG